MTPPERHEVVDYLAALTDDEYDHLTHEARFVHTDALNRAAVRALFGPQPTTD